MQAAEVARWWSLHEDLHAATQACAELAWKLHVATQVPAQLVELVGAWGRRWRLGRRGPGYGPTDSLGKGLAGGRQAACRGVAVVPGKALSGGLMDLLGWDPAEGLRLLVLI